MPLKWIRRKLPDGRTAVHQGHQPVPARRRHASELEAARREIARLRRARRVDRICHRDQMEIWTGEALQHLIDHIREPADYEDALALNRAVKAAIRDVVGAALDHPDVSVRE